MMRIFHSLILPLFLLAWTGCGVGGVAAVAAGEKSRDEGDSDDPATLLSAVEVALQTHGLVAVTVSLSDSRFRRTDSEREPGDPDPRARIHPEYQAPGTKVWRPMTPAEALGHEGTRGLALGKRLFVWNSLVDVGRTWTSLEIRARAEYEPTSGGRAFRTRSARVEIDNRLSVTILGGELDRIASADSVPVDLRADGAGFVVACLGSNILERVCDDGGVERLAGLGTAGGEVTQEQDSGSVRLPAITGVALDGAGNLYATHGSLLTLANRGDADLRVGGVTVRPGKLGRVLDGLEGAVSPRFHPSGALLFLESPGGVDRVVGWNPADPGDPAATSIQVGSVTLSPGSAQTVVGEGQDPSDGVDLLEAELVSASALAVGPDGELYVAERELGRVRLANLSPHAISAGGVTVEPGAVATVAGEGLLGDRGDRGPATSARFNLLAGIDVTPDRALLVVDLQRRPRLRLVNLGTDSVTCAGTIVESGNVDTVAGGQFDPVGSLAPDLDLAEPHAVTVDSEGLILVTRGTEVIVLNPGAERVRAYGQPILPSRTVGIYDATRRAGLPLQEPRAAHLLHQTRRDVFLTDRTTVRVLNHEKVSRDYAGIRVMPGESVVLGGGAVEGFSGDGGPARKAAFARPSGLASHLSADAESIHPLLYVADTGNDRIRVIHLGDPATGATLSVLGTQVAAGAVETVVGGSPDPGPTAGDGDGPREAGLLRPEGIAVARIGIQDLLFVSDTGHHRIRVVNPGPNAVVLGAIEVGPGTIETLIGDGVPGFTADGPGPWRIDTPMALATFGELLIFGEQGNARIRVANFGATTVALATIQIPPGEVRTLVGNGARGNAGDGDLGPFTEIDSPRGFFLQTGLGVPTALYFTDHAQHVVRVLNLKNDQNVGIVDDADGKVLTHLAPGAVRSIAGGPNLPGTSNSPGFDGDGGEPETVRFNRPFGIVWTSLDLSPTSVFVADEGNHRLRAFGAAPTRGSYGP